MDVSTQKPELEKIWVHKICGEEIVSELMYSDSKEDYYYPVCYRCQVSPELAEMELREKGNQ